MGRGSEKGVCELQGRVLIINCKYPSGVRLGLRKLLFIFNSQGPSLGEAGGVGASDSPPFSLAPGGPGGGGGGG